MRHLCSLTRVIPANCLSASLKRHQWIAPPSFAFLHSFMSPNYLTILDQFEVGPLSCRALHSYLTHYRSAFAYSNLLYLQSYRLSYDAPSFVTKGALQAYHVPPFERVDLAACYKPKGIVDGEKVIPRASSIPFILRCQPFTVIGLSRSFNTGSDVFGISTTYYLPRVWLPGGSSAHALAPALCASLLCPTRSLFRVVGSSSRMDGGITPVEYHSSYGDFVSHSHSLAERTHSVLNKRPVIPMIIGQIIKPAMNRLRIFM